MLRSQRAKQGTAHAALLLHSSSRLLCLSEVEAACTAASDTPAGLGQQAPGGSGGPSYKQANTTSLAADEASTAGPLHQSSLEGMLKPPESMDSVVCWDANADVVFVPGGHACSCTACAEHLVGKAALCPVCRGQIDGSISLQPC